MTIDDSENAPHHSQRVIGAANPANRAVSMLYQGLMTGFVLALVTRRGEADAAEFVFRHFRRQHLEKFLPGLAKLGLDRLPHAVACAQYHDLSNRIGGVKTEYIYESDRKAWVRYPPPRWIWHGAAICAVPSRVNAAMLHGWHGHNGVSLGNPRLGFVCTGQTVDGHPGLEGYYLEYDRPLAPEERVRFAYGEVPPPIDPARVPRLDPTVWTPERLDKVVARYAMEYVRSLLVVALDLLGPDETRRVLGHAARLIGMQFYDDTAALIGVTGSSAAAFAGYLSAVARAQGEDVEVQTDGAAATLLQRGWRLMAGLDDIHPAGFDSWCELWRGALSVHDRRLALDVDRRPRGGAIEFRIRAASPAPQR